MSIDHSAEGRQPDLWGNFDRPLNTTPDMDAAARDALPPTGNGEDLRFPVASPVAPVLGEAALTELDRQPRSADRTTGLERPRTINLEGLLNERPAPTSSRRHILWLLGGGAAAVAVGGSLAYGMSQRGSDKPSATPPAPAGAVPSAANATPTPEAVQNRLPNVVARAADNPPQALNINRLHTANEVRVPFGQLEIVAPELVPPNVTINPEAEYTTLLARMFVNIAALTTLDPGIQPNNPGVPTNPDFLKVFANFSDEDPTKGTSAETPVLSWILARNTDFQSRYQGQPYTNQNIIFDDGSIPMVAHYDGMHGLDYVIGVGDSGGTVLSRALGQNCVFTDAGTCGINLSSSVPAAQRATWQDSRAAVAAEGAPLLKTGFAITYNYFNDPTMPTGQRIKVLNIAGGEWQYRY